MTGGRVDVVGESYYQDALVRITGRKKWVAVYQECVAALIPETGNPHDANAVRVEVDGLQVGHLSRADAASYRPLLLALSRTGHRATCEAVICGSDASGNTANMGVILDVAPAEACWSGPGASGTAKARRP